MHANPSTVLLLTLSRHIPPHYATHDQQTVASSYCGFMLHPLNWMEPIVRERFYLSYDWPISAKSGEEPPGVDVPSCIKVIAHYWDTVYQREKRVLGIAS